MRPLTCGNCFKGSVDPKHDRYMHGKGRGDSSACRVAGCDCLGWTPRYPTLVITDGQAKRLQVLAQNADKLEVAVGGFDLPEGYVTAWVTYPQGNAVFYGIDTDGRASS